MVLDRHLIIHAGSHKTGSSALQKALKLNTELLYKNNIANLIIDKKADNRTLVKKPKINERFIRNGYSVRPLSLKRLIKKSQEEENLMIAKKQIQDSDQLKFIVSSESLSWIFQIGEIEKLRNSLGGHFEKIQVVFYVRRQDKIIRSHHKQGSITEPANIFYGNSLQPDLNLQDHFDSYLDFKSRISLWSQVFGSDNIFVRVMDKNSLVENDITIDFFTAIGLPHVAQTIDISNCREINTHNKVEEKLSRLSRELKESMAGSRPWLKKLARKISSKLEFSEIECSSDWSLKVLNHYEQSNYLLSNEFNLGHTWYQFNEVDNQESWEWTEDEANIVISQLLLELYQSKQNNNKQSIQ